MAKPVVGYLGYDEGADRPTVKLVSGTKRLLTQDDAGGGGAVTDVTSGSAAIDVSPTTGNVVVSLDKAELENGGGQELNVAGLSGVLANAQVADTLRVTGPTDLTLGTVTDGDYLVRAGSTVVGANSGLEIPDSGHADNEDFNGTADTLPSGWGYFVDNAGGSNVLSATTLVAGTGTPAVGIQPYTNVASGGTNSLNNVRFNVNSKRRSWLHLQFPSEATNFVRRMVLMRRCTTVFPTDFTVIAHVGIGWTDNTVNIDPGGNQFALVLSGDGPSTSVPGLDAAAGRVRAILHVGNDSSAGSHNWVANVITSNGTSNVTTTPAITPLQAGLMYIPHPPEYLRIDGRGTTFHYYLGGREGGWRRIATHTPTGVAAASFRWWGFAHFGIEDSDPWHSYLGVDWIRRWDTSDFIV